MKLINNGNKET